MGSLKQYIIKFFKRFDIYIYRAAHESHFELRKRISRELIESSNGVLHIGANEGQEAAFYADCKSKVLWIEAIPEISEELSKKLIEYPQQSVICALLGSQNETNIRFNIASNDGASSSLYLPKLDMNPPFEITHSILLNMSRLDSLISTQEASELNHWVIDVQGAELPVLLGAGNLLKYCNSLVVEARTESAYYGGTKYPDLARFLKEAGFIPLWDIEENQEDNIFFLRVSGRI